MSEEIALFCQVYPKAADGQKRLLDLLRKSSREYYSQDYAGCTTWCYFTPFPPPKPSSDQTPLICGLEIYTDKSALTAQLTDTKYFQPYHETVGREELYAKAEDLVAWYKAAGFIARKDHATPFGSALISTSTFVCSDRAKVLQLIANFSKWVDTNEPGVLTYAAFQRPKAPKEVMLFVRYADRNALKGHSTAPEHDDIIKQISQYTENSLAQATKLWQEVEDSFVSTQVGIGSSGSSSKL